jgi:hypothetical protein
VVGARLTFPATARNWTCVMRVRLPLPVEEVAEPEPAPPATEVLTDALTEAVTEAATEVATEPKTIENGQ